MAEQLQRKIRQQIALDQSSCFMLSEQMDIDLRGIKRLVEDAFASAVQRNESVAYVWPSNFKSLGQDDSQGIHGLKYLH